MTTLPAPEPPSESTLEARLFKRLDDYMTEIKDTLRRQGEKIDRLSEDRVTRDEHDALRRRVDMQGTDVAVHDQRLTVLEGDQSAEDHTRRQRPVQTWQLLLMAIAVLTSLFFDFVTATIAIINLVLLLKH